ncbi:MAG: DUF2275 domain-containing protein [Nitrospirae bacterium]|nr:DUF2275 domain-containing protein [Nitrospirota bacterium]
MECKDIQEKLSAYIEEILSSEEKMRVDEHLKSCNACRMNLADLKKTIEFVKELDEVESPSWLTQKVMAKIRAEAEQKESIWKRLFSPLSVKLPIGAAATILLAITAFYVFKSIQPEVIVTKAPSEEPTQIITEKETARDIKDKEPVIVQYQESKPMPLPTKEQPMPTPSPAEKIEKDIPAAGAVAKDELRQESMSVPKMRAMAVGKKELPVIMLSVKDRATAQKEIENIIAQLNGKINRKESLNNKDVFLINIESKRLKKFIEKLKTIGEVREKDFTFEGYEGMVEMRVEVERK